jgi:hypothetical protein
MTAVSENDIPDPSRRTVKVEHSYYYLIQDLPVSCAMPEMLNISPVICVSLKRSLIIQEQQSETV